MPCVLQHCSTIEADFQASVGSKFEIDVDSDSGHAILVFARYNGVTKTAAPWAFDVAPKVLVLTVVAESPHSGERINLLEVCGAGKTNALNSFFYSPKSSPDGLEIKGL